MLGFQFQRVTNNMKFFSIKVVGQKLACFLLTHSNCFFESDSRSYLPFSYESHDMITGLCFTSPYRQNVASQHMPDLTDELMKKGKHCILIENPLDILVSSHVLCIQICTHLILIFLII